MTGLVILIWMALFLALAILPIAGQWKTFTKAGQPGWAAIVPIYNFYVCCKVAQRPGWWTLLIFVPLVNLVVDIVVLVDLASAFGKNAWFGLGLFLLPIVFFPILGFGAAAYIGRPGIPLSLSV